MAIYVNRDLAKKYLSSPSDDKWFYLQDGNALKSIYDLQQYLSNCGDDGYKKYVNGERNDFYSWVKGVFSNTRLAAGLKKARTPNEARLYVDRNIKMLEKNAKR